MRIGADFKAVWVTASDPRKVASEAEVKDSAVLRVEGLVEVV